ncbi:MAG: hypothetical protein F9K45_12315, partial [Melioribacteraceae bacterium]
MNTFSKISSLRQSGDNYLDSALTIAKELSSHNTTILNNISELEIIRKKRNDLRSNSDQILTRSTADKAFLTLWIDAQTELIMKGNNLAKALFVSNNKLENVLEFNSIVKNSIFYASEFAGRERAEIGALIGNSSPIKGEQLNNLMRYRGVVEENIRSILEVKKNPN